MKTSSCTITVIAIAAMLSSCVTPPAQSPPAARPQPSVNPTAFSPASTLVGAWHNNHHEEGGATKRFVPHIKGKGNLLQGTAYGFWPTGGTYVITRSDASTRSLTIQVSIPKNEDQDADSFVADVSFDAAGKHMTFTRKGGKPVVFYRVK